MKALALLTSLACRPTPLTPTACDLRHYWLESRSSGVRHGKWRDRRMRFHMKYMAGILTSSCLYLSSATAIAAAPQEGNRASMLYIVLVAGVMIVAMKLVIAFAKKKMEAEARKAAQDKLGRCSARR